MNRDLADLITAQLKYSEVCHLGLLSPRTMHLKNLLRNAQAKGRNHLHGLSSLWRDYQRLRRTGGRLDNTLPVQVRHTTSKAMP